jgi:hypothetical protein
VDRGSDFEQRFQYLLLERLDAANRIHSPAEVGQGVQLADPRSVTGSRQPLPEALVEGVPFRSMTVGPSGPPIQPHESSLASGVAVRKTRLNSDWI